MGSLANKTYSRKVELRKRVLEELIHELSRHVNYLTALQASPEAQYFKPAIRKFETEYRFMPVNLQLNRFNITGENSTIDDNIYDTITFGVGSDHVKKKSKFGLLKYVIEQQKKNENLFDINRFSPIMVHYFKLVNSLQELKQQQNLYENQINKYTNESLNEFLVLIKSIVILASDDCMKQTMQLFTKDCLQFTIWDSLLIELDQAMVALSKTLSTTDNTPSREKCFKNCHEVCSNMLRMAISALYLADVVKDEIDYQQHDSSATTDSDVANMIFSDTEDIAKSRIDAEFNYLVRRDVVNSQVIAAAALGIVSSVTKNWGNESYWSQIEAHGLLLNFNTLVSTWRAEQTMDSFYSGATVLVQPVPELSMAWFFNPFPTLMSLKGHFLNMKKFFRF